MEIACTGAKLCAHMASCFQATQSFAPHGICAKNRPTNQMRQLKELKEYIYICQKKIAEITQMHLGFTCSGGKKSITSACLLAGVGLLSRDTSPLHPESQTATNSWLVSHSWQEKSSECYFHVRNEKKWQDIKFSTMSLCWQIRHLEEL